MAEKKLPVVEGPSNNERERICRQLQFLAAVTGERDSSYLNEDEAHGLSILLYELADKVFPEGIQPE